MAKRNVNGEQARALAIYERLRARYPDAKVALNYTTALDLLVATILAAQSTDVRVNIVTETLFQRFRTPEDYVNAPLEEFESLIRPCGFYHQKARAVRNACRRIIDAYGGTVPDTMESLLTLDGVGRKTANVVLGAIYGVPGVIVDTHVRRLAARLGFTEHTDPDKIERDLMALWPEKLWTQFSHAIVFHGRNICVARLPKCSICPVNDLCPYPKTGKPHK